MKKIDWQKLHDFANENKDFLIMIASPKTDEIYVAFNGLNTFVRFPMETMDKGVVFNALRKSKFEQAIDPFMEGLISSTGIKETDEGGEVLKVLGGSMKGMGIAAKRSSSLEVINSKANGKESGGKGGRKGGSKAK